MLPNDLFVQLFGFFIRTIEVVLGMLTK